MANLFEFQNITWLAGASLVVLSTLVQGLSKKYKPWSYIAKQLGKAMNQEIVDKLDVLEKKVVRLEERDDEQDRLAEKEKALSARRRIIRFADECRRKEKHSEEYFNNVLEDISDYKQYCNDNPDFENEKAVLATERIETVYNHCLEFDDFL